MCSSKIISSLALLTCANAWTLWTSTPQFTKNLKNGMTSSSMRSSLSPTQATGGSLHGQDACFLPLEQLDEEYYAPRIIQIAGSYPGLQKENYLAVTSEPPAELGQWTYDFSDPNGPQLGTVAVKGNEIISKCEDPVAIIGEHFALGIPLPDVLTEPVDILVVVDRAKKGFAERKFLVVEMPGDNELLIRAFPTKADLPQDATILGQVLFVQIPWLPCMKKSKSGFAEEDELF